MTYQELLDILETTDVPFAFHHWEKPPRPPYGVYFDDYSDNFSADCTVFLEVDHIMIELYQRQRDKAVEARISTALTAAGIYWEKDAQYLPTERLYQTTFEIEV